MFGKKTKPHEAHHKYDNRCRFCLLPTQCWPHMKCLPKQTGDHPFFGEVKPKKVKPHPFFAKKVEPPPPVEPAPEPIVDDVVEKIRGKAEPVCVDGLKCQYCKEQISVDDYTSLPAHIHCVTSFLGWMDKRKKEQTIARKVQVNRDPKHGGTTMDDPCKECHKSWAESPRKLYADGTILKVCIACNQYFIDRRNRA